MSGRVLIVKNMDFVGPGLLLEALQHNDIEADGVELVRGDSIPALDPYSALIILGGPQSANDDTPEMRMQLEAIAEAMRSGLPFLGICLGHQLLAKAAGAEVVSGPSEWGFADADGTRHVVTLTEAGLEDPLFDSVPPAFPAFHSHGEMIVPNVDVEVLAIGVNCPVQAIRVGRRAYGVQFHNEMTDEMLASWIPRFPELADVETAVPHEVEAAGTLILTNFLSLAGLVQPINLAEDAYTNR